MKSSWKLAVAVFVAFAGASALLAAEGGTEATVALGKATLGDAVSNDQKEILAPGPGKRFLWVAAKLSGAPTVVDLTKVALVSGSETFPLESFCLLFAVPQAFKTEQITGLGAKAFPLPALATTARP